MNSGHHPLVSAAFARAKVAMLALVVLSLIGLSTYRHAPREADPDIPLPFVQVLLPLPGVSPEDGERLLIRPTETELQSLEGLEEMNAVAFDGAAAITLEFEPGLDMDQVVSDVREAVDRAKTKYPTSAEEPQVAEFNAQQLFPVITVILSGEAPERALFRAAKELEDKLTAIPGVLEADLIGSREEQVEITIRAETLETFGLTPGEISNAIRRNNALVTAGTLRFEDGAYSVKVPGLFRDLNGIGEIPIRSNEDSVITLGDIADIRRTFEEPTGYALFNGQPAIGINISKQTEANLLEVTQAVVTETELMAEGWPSTIRTDFIGDQSSYVSGMFSSLTSTIGLAIILVMIIVVAALGIRSAVLVGIAIPASFLIGFAQIGFFGFTLNNLVMFSMVLAVGMLVDGAIVIVELADRRMAEGADRREAFLDASTRMFWPIVASTATTLAAFVPFLFWNSIEGYFLRWIPITLILVLSASLFVALIFLPIIGSAFAIPEAIKRKFNIKGQGEGRDKVDLDNVDPTKLRGFTGQYARSVDWLARKPVTVAVLGLLTVMFCQKIFTLANVEVEQFLRVDSEQVLVIVQGRGNLSQEEVLSITQEIEARVVSHSAVENAYLQTGPEISRQNDTPAESIALINLDLIPYADRQHSLDVVEDLRANTTNVPGVIVEVRLPEQGPMVGKDVQVEITADDFEKAEAAGLLIRDFLESNTTDINGQDIPTFMDIEDNQALPGIEWQLEIDRAEAGRYGLSVADVGAAIQLGTEGLIVDTYRPDDSDEELDIRLRYPADERTVGGLTNINIATPRGNVPLANFARQVPQPQVDRITRRDSRRVIDVKANANTSVRGFEVSQDKATAAITEYLDSGFLERAIGAGLQVRLHGAAEETQESSAFFVGAMIAAMFMIAVILLLQFNNFYHAFLTLTAVVFSVFGVLLGVAVSGQYISVIMTGIGIVALAGIVVNNNIVLIDTFHSLRKTGLSVHEAAVRTAAQRLRPVLLTTVTTIIGLMPMMLEIDINFGAARLGIGNETSDWWVLLSSAIVYGLGFSTLLTLLFTPVMLAAPAVLSTRISKAYHWLLDKEPKMRRHLGRKKSEDGETPYRTAAE
ncbi:efflux RND transporter permease subunit [Parvularcula marina]|uniref:AcrB/AcrD/AcrF family protein n=1 Tax=Parvularcula marina TaxID=2292771 RepID=A0A371RHD3_9PROT|nr:efflux RND transporter permease subunit [Parvularcula marina]RFB04863.1 AcrB/AcrD/AcrF family protein [Parvularcula marina]